MAIPLSDAIDFRRLFEDNLDLIEQVVRYVCRRRGFFGDEEDGFRSYVFLKLVDQDYGVLRKFQGNSSLKTYLVTVTVRLASDYRIEKWGKWRPSKMAERLGPNALLLEKLRFRDGHPLEEAIAVMRLNHGVAESADSLRELAASMPERVPRRAEGEDALANLSHPSRAPDQKLMAVEAETGWKVVLDKLSEALRALDTEDRLIVRMRYDKSASVATIARALGLPQKPLYRRFQSLLGGLRLELERNGVTQEEIRRLLGEVSE